MERRIRWKLAVLCALLLSACEKRKRDKPVEQTDAGAARAKAVLPRCAPEGRTRAVRGPATVYLRPWRLAATARRGVTP